MTDQVQAILWIVGAFAAFAGLMAVLAVRTRALPGKFLDKTRAIGFVPSSATVIGATHHWVRKGPGRPAIVGYYPGSSRTTGYAGVMLMVQIGALPGGRWGADLTTRPPKVNGPAEGREQILAALSPAVLAASEGLEAAMVMPGEGLMPGNTLSGVVEADWPGGWQGLHIRAVMSRSADMDSVAATLDQLNRVADALG